MSLSHLVQLWDGPDRLFVRRDHHSKERWEQQRLLHRDPLVQEASFQGRMVSSVLCRKITQCISLKTKSHPLSSSTTGVSFLGHPCESVITLFWSLYTWICPKTCYLLLWDENVSVVKMFAPIKPHCFLLIINSFGQQIQPRAITACLLAVSSFFNVVLRLALTWNWHLTVNNTCSAGTLPNQKLLPRPTSCDGNRVKKGSGESHSPSHKEDRWRKEVTGGHYIKPMILLIWSWDKELNVPIKVRWSVTSTDATKSHPWHRIWRKNICKPHKLFY